MKGLKSRLNRLESTLPASGGPTPRWALELAEARHRELVTGETGQVLAKIIGPREYDPAEVERMARELAATFRDREDAERGRPLSPAAQAVRDKILAS